MNIRCISNPHCTLGEGPFWDKDKQLLYWVDILENKIYRFNPADEKTTSWTTPSYVGFITIKNGRFIAGLKSGLYYLTLNNDGTVATEEIIRLDDGLDNLRVNDGTIDSKGRVWACTMDMNNKLPLGKFYCFDNDGTTKVIDEGYIVGNGPALSADGNTLYTVESVGSNTKKKGIYEFTWKDNKFHFQRLLIDWTWDTYPDGIIMDKKGRLWVAEYSGNTLRCFLPDGTLHSEIALPAFNITKAAFGGVNDDKIYVTSASLGFDNSTLEKYPYTGGVLEIGRRET